MAALTLILSGIVLGTPDPQALASFYEPAARCERTQDEPGWVTTRPPGGGPGLSLPTEPEHVPPVWAESQDDVGV